MSKQDDDPIRVGLVGAGMIGRFRARALARTVELRLAGIADETIESARSLASAEGVPVFDSAEALATDAGIDAVIVSTPPAGHAPVGLACLRAGKHVLVEKPLARTVEECERLVAAADTAGLCLATGFTLRKTPAAKLAKRLVERGQVGELDHLRAFHGHGGGKDFGPPWILDAEVSGGGTLMDNGIHMIDLVRWFLGDVAESTGMASAHTWKKRGCEDNGFVLMRSTKGQIGLVHSSWTEWKGYGYRVEVYGTEGAVCFGYPPLWLVHHRIRSGGRTRVRRHFFPRYQVEERLRGWQWSLVETLADDQRDWAAAIRAGSEAPASGRDGLESVRIAQWVRS